jgi:hypothetical protein
MVPNGDGPRQKINEIVGGGIDVGPVGAGGSGPLATKTLLFVGQGASGRVELAKMASTCSVLLIRRQAKWWLRSYSRQYRAARR